jgi:hypothetical protein
MSQTSSNHFKFGASGISSATRGGFSVGVKGGADYGPTISTGFWNGVKPPVGGYTIYVDKASQGPSIHVAADDAQCITILKAMGATGSTIGDVLAWVGTQSNMAILSAELTLGDLPGGGPSIVTSGLTLHLDANTYSGTGTWNDLTANGFTATEQGTVPFTSAGDLSYFTFETVTPVGNYLLGNAGLNTATTNPVDGTLGVTISTVFQSSNMGRNNNLFSQVNGGGYNFDCGTTSTLWVNTLRSFAAANTSTDRRGTTPVLSNNVIYLMTMVWDQVNKVATLYLNGSEISSYENSGGAGSLTTGWATNYGASFQLGAMTYYSQYALGNMYKTMVYNRALSSGEVTTNYDAIKTRFGI